jgi:hypothetical protein
VTLHPLRFGFAPEPIARFLKDQEAEIILKRRVKTIPAVGKRHRPAGFGVAAAKLPRDPRVPDGHDIHSDALPARIGRSALRQRRDMADFIAAAV